MVAKNAVIEVRMLCVALLCLALSVLCPGKPPADRASSRPSPPPAGSFKLAFSTYLSGSGRANEPRAVAVDAKGNIYVSGGTSSRDFPTTPGAYSRKFDGSGKSAGTSGPFDAYVTKLTPDGKMVWSTLVGGPHHDRTYSIRVDRRGCVYIAGRAGEGFPTTKGVIQEKFAGDNRPAAGYGPQDGFITKLSADGSKVLWSTYFGAGDNSVVRDMVIDDKGNVYVGMIGVSVDSPYVTRGAFQTTRPGRPDGLVAKISADGRRVIWATYLGGSGREGAVSIRLDAKGCVLVSGATSSKDFPVTEGAYQRTLRGPGDAYVAKLTPDGSKLVYATYLGGSKGDGGAGKHGLEVDAEGNAYVGGFTSSADFPTTAGALQAAYAGGRTGTWEQTGDRFIAKLSPDGRPLLASTYLGGNARDGGEGIAVDRHGQVYVNGFTYSTDFPVSAGAMRTRRAGKTDGTISVLSADFSRAVLSSHLGGRGEDGFRAIAMCPGGGFVIVGGTSSADWPVLNALQPRPRGGGNDAVVMKFVPVGAK